MKKIIVTALLLISSSAMAEECIQEKLDIENLKQQNAQLQVNNAQLMFNAANAEKTRLEGVKKANGTAESNPPAPAPAPAPTAAPQQ